MECPLCRNNNYKWIDLDRRADLHFIGELHTPVYGQKITKACAECGFIAQFFKVDKETSGEGQCLSKQSEERL